MTSLPPRISSELLEVSTAMWQSLQTARACASSSPCQLALTAAIFSGPALLPPPAQSRSAFVIFSTSSFSGVRNRDYYSQKNSSVTFDSWKVDREFLKAASNFMTRLRRYILCCACWDLPVGSQGRPSLSLFKLISLKIRGWKKLKLFVLALRLWILANKDRQTKCSAFI